MAETEKRVSVLADRVAAGKADPISEEEREIVASLRAFYERKYGRDERARGRGAAKPA